MKFLIGFVIQSALPRLLVTASRLQAPFPLAHPHTPCAYTQIAIGLHSTGKWSRLRRSLRRSHNQFESRHMSNICHAPERERERDAERERERGEQAFDYISRMASRVELVLNAIWRMNSCRTVLQIVFKFPLKQRPPPAPPSLHQSRIHSHILSRLS